MKSYIESEITITAAQRAEVGPWIVKELCEAVWTDGWEVLMEIFDEAFYEALAEVTDIELTGDGPRYDRSRLIVDSEEGPIKLGDLQKAIWQKRIGKGCPQSILAAAVDEMLDASFELIGIKVIKAAKAPKERARLRSVA